MRRFISFNDIFDGQKRRESRLRCKFPVCNRGEDSCLLCRTKALHSTLFFVDKDASIICHELSVLCAQACAFTAEN